MSLHIVNNHSNFKAFSLQMRLILLLTTCVLLGTSCKKFLDVGVPKTSLTSESVFSDDITAGSAIAEVYGTLITSSYANGSTFSYTYLGALSADELDRYNTYDADTKGFYDNTILPTSTILSFCLWESPYKTIYQTNAILEGIKNSNKLSDKVKNRLTGEAKFIRAFTYFYLINLFGDVPLVLSTNYKANSSIVRSSMDSVLNQIISDLLDSQNLLDGNYLGPDNSSPSVERSRVNKFAATALLARAYLYKKDWKNAEIQASAVIDHVALYGLEPLDHVFLKNSREAIWQLSNDYQNTNDIFTWILFGPPYDVALRDSFVSSFEVNDRRKATWIGVVDVLTNRYYYASKYKAFDFSNITEYSMVLRLAEQYLIRAEARINLDGGIANGVQDLNVIRERASLPQPQSLEPLPLNLSKARAMQALEAERRHELFTEWGHRWLDLKRLPSVLFPGDPTRTRADDVLQNIKPNWKREWKLYPIPQTQITNDPAMANQQNPGY